MRRSLVLVAAAMALPLASAESQGSRRRNPSDSTDSMGSVIRAAASAGVGIGAGLLYAFGNDGFEGSWDSWYGGSGASTRRSTAASLVQTGDSFFRGAPLGSDEVSTPGNVSFAENGNGQSGAADDASAQALASNIRRLASRMMLVADEVEGLRSTRNARIRPEQAPQERYTSAGPAGGVGGGGAGTPYVPVADLVDGTPGSEFGDDPLGSGGGAGGVGGPAELDVIVNPEPGTVALTVVGLGLLFGFGRRNRRRTA